MSRDDRFACVNASTQPDCQPYESQSTGSGRARRQVYGSSSLVHRGPSARPRRVAQVGTAAAADQLWHAHEGELNLWDCRSLIGYVKQVT